MDIKEVRKIAAMATEQSRSSARRKEIESELPKCFRSNPGATLTQEGKERILSMVAQVKALNRK